MNVIIDFLASIRYAKIKLDSGRERGGGEGEEWWEGKGETRG